MSPVCPWYVLRMSQVCPKNFPQMSLACLLVVPCISMAYIHHLPSYMIFVGYFCMNVNICTGQDIQLMNQSEMTVSPGIHGKRHKIYTSNVLAEIILTEKVRKLRQKVILHKTV